MKLRISKEFSETLGGRFKSDGEHSGEEFYESLLKPYFLEVLDTDNILTIDLDGTYGYPSSFIDQSFGELSRVYGKKEVLKKLKFISNDQPGLVKLIKENIENPNQLKNDE